MLDQLLDSANWKARANGRKYLISNAAVSGPIVVANAQDVGTAAPGNTCSYLPPPFDVQGTTGVPAELFAGFPMYVL